MQTEINEFLDDSVSALLVRLEKRYPGDRDEQVRWLKNAQTYLNSFPLHTLCVSADGISE